MQTVDAFAAQRVETKVIKRRVRPSLLYVPALIFLCVFFLAPLMENVLRSVAPAHEGGAVNLRFYTKLISDPYYLRVIANTLKVSFVTTAICAVVGYPVAYFLVRRAGRFGPVLLFLLVAPLLTSIIMRTFGWRILLARHGMVNEAFQALHLIDRPLNVLNSAGSVYMGLVHVMVPFMVLSITPVLQGVDRRLEESARILGAGAVRTFLNVTLPLSIEGIVTGCILVFMLTNGSFVTMLLLGGGQVVTLPVLIFQQFSLTQDIGFAAAMGNLLLFIVLVCLFVQQRFASGRGARP
ncbi:ABC transporter permease [Caballeronia mineralivorans]|jgi:putative spermidine/putrescine transport system permease protein|uniref:ABC transporter permease n=1 Tax=Caballeronia mineralivorans TaxID=2010198 RepID=UPI0023F25015|nr:ABC transporter permease [Caballeronia mineralivorans]MDB5781191.1 transporter permease [Caballeronia mineralivorans]MEA3104368.1 putative spermidine/putrescine transport system permease protein [Caballeronia mineralivorans]